MTNFATIAFVSLLAFASSSMAATVDLRTDETLKPFFDAGLRPTKVRGIVNQCEIGPTPMSFILSDGKSVSFADSTATITIDRHDRISLVQAFTRYLTLQEARQASEVIHKEFQKPFEPCLAYLEKVKENYIWPGAEYSITSDTKPQMTIGFQGGISKERPLRMIFSLVWPREWKGIDDRREPIRPPRGYETVSMEKPPNPNLKTSSTEPPMKLPPMVESPEPKKAPRTNPIPTPVEAPATSRPLSILMMVVAASVLLWLLRKRRS